MEEYKDYRAPSQRIAFLGQLCAAAATGAVLYAFVLAVFSL